ncbi:hypothetical protein STA1M1_37730 [Sinisalibacter aestuarii]|uniref:Uncharacterized protein n=2 Tax=Sinisalibacter aestuarii TaxID=2949426 RepID=A0ABQ5LY97_9RHOB|nr:hypothetical protein STA1M1_37730 [Sinisalibacter aestuarii]
MKIDPDSVIRLLNIIDEYTSGSPDVKPLYVESGSPCEKGFARASKASGDASA